MAKLTIKEVTDKKTWENFLEKNAASSFLQSWYWGEFHSNIGHPIYRTGFYNHEKLVGIMLSIVESAKRAKYLTVPAGPIIDWQNTESIDTFLTEIKRQATSEKCIFVRVRPQMVVNDFSKHLFQKIGFRSAPAHLHAELTSQLDITKSEEQLLANMRKATRYEIKKAINQQIKITTTDNPDAIKKFYELQLLTAKRQDFVPFSYKYLYQQFKVFTQEKKALLYSAEFEDKLLAQAFIIFYNQEAAYHYGASTQEGRKYPGAYLIQWEAIKEAKRRTMQRYNFWGVAPEEQKSHRFYGLSIFKRGFGGVDLEYLHAQDLVINKPKYIINSAVENIRKRIRHT